jgi:hypothetical protein
MSDPHCPSWNGDEMNETRAPATHDYTRRGWGHDVGISHSNHAGFEVSAYGWGGGIREGDYLILPNRDTTTRYEVRSIAYQRDSPDMWFAELLYAPGDAT